MCEVLQRFMLAINLPQPSFTWAYDWPRKNIARVPDFFLIMYVITCRYDWLANKSLRAGYFLWAMFAYGLGKQIMKITCNYSTCTDILYR